MSASGEFEVQDDFSDDGDFSSGTENEDDAMELSDSSEAEMLDTDEEEQEFIDDAVFKKVEVFDEKPKPVKIAPAKSSSSRPVPKKTMLLEASEAKKKKTAKLAAFPLTPTEKKRKREEEQASSADAKRTKPAAAAPKAKAKAKPSVIKPKAKTPAAGEPDVKTTVDFGDIVMCMTAGALPDKTSGRGQKMVVTSGNTKDCVLEINTLSPSGKHEKPTDTQVRVFYEAHNKKYSDLVQVSHLLPEIDNHSPENSHNKGAVLQGFLVPRRTNSKSKSKNAVIPVHWYFFPLTPTNELKLYRKEYVGSPGQGQQGQVQAKYMETIRAQNIRQSNGPLTVEFPKGTGMQWSFDHRWFSTSGFEYIKNQNQRPNANRSKPANAPASVSASAKKPEPPAAPAAPAKKTPAPQASEESLGNVKLVLENQAQILKNQERIMKFMGSMKIEFPSF